MKLIKVSVDNFLQIKGLDLELGEKPVHLIAGLNESGKSSLHEAIRFAYLGETNRVSLKRDYRLMVRDGAQNATVRIDFENGQGELDFVQRDVATGKVVDGYAGDPEFAIAHVMDATKIPLLSAAQQRDFLLEFLNVKVDADDVRKRMVRRGVAEEYIEMVLPMLRAGFAAAHKEAKERQSRARAMWEQLTGEKWGSQKGAQYKPERKLVVTPAVEAKEREVEKYRGAYERASVAVGRSYEGGFTGPCPACGEAITFTGQDYKLRSEEAGSMEEAQATIDAKRKRDELYKLYEQSRAEYEEMKRDLEFNLRLEDIEAEAKVLHDSTLRWLQLADLLAPEGIPGEILADALKPINDRLRHTATVSGWDQVTITPTLDIMVGTRPYLLGSESAQWRAQAAIAEAVSYVGEIGLLCLDRIDVLDLPNRGRLLKWIQEVSEDHNTVLLFGTLKEPPKKLPPAFELHWLDHGEFTEAAAA